MKISGDKIGCLIIGVVLCLGWYGLTSGQNTLCGSLSLVMCLNALFIGVVALIYKFFRA